MYSSLRVPQFSDEPICIFMSPTQQLFKTRTGHVTTLRFHVKILRGHSMTNNTQCKYKHATIKTRGVRTTLDLSKMIRNNQKVVSS